MEVTKYFSTSSVNELMTSSYIEGCFMPERFLELITQHILDLEKAFNQMNLAQVDAFIDPSDGGVMLLRQAQEALRASERQFRAVFEYALDAIVISDDLGYFVDANLAACKLYGLPREELIGLHVNLFFEPEFKDYFGEVWSKFCIDENVDRGEVVLVRRDGSRLEAEYAVTANVLQGRHLAVLRDMTARKKAERTLREASHLQQEILNALPASMVLIDHTGQILMVNAFWQHFADANDLMWPDGGQGRNYLTVCEHAVAQGDTLSGEVIQGIKGVLSGDAQTFNLDYPCHSPDLQRWFRLLVAPIQAADHRKAVVIHIDITEVKFLELQRAQAHKLEAVGSVGGRHCP